MRCKAIFQQNRKAKPGALSKLFLQADARNITEQQANQLNSWLKNRVGEIPLSGVSMADIDSLAEAWEHAAEEGN